MRFISGDRFSIAIHSIDQAMGVDDRQAYDHNACAWTRMSLAEYVQLCSTRSSLALFWLSRRSDKADLALAPENSP